MILENCFSVLDSLRFIETVHCSSLYICTQNVSRMYLLRVILDIENSSSKNWINKNVMIYRSKETILCDFSNTFWLTVCPNHVFYSTIKHPIKSNNLTNLCKVLILRNFFSTNICNTPKSDGQDKSVWSRQSSVPKYVVNEKPALLTSLHDYNMC